MLFLFVSGYINLFSNLHEYSSSKTVKKSVHHLFATTTINLHKFSKATAWEAQCFERFSLTACHSLDLICITDGSDNY